MIFRSAEKTFFLSASCSADVRLWVEKALEGKVKKRAFGALFFLFGWDLPSKSGCQDVRPVPRCADVFPVCLRMPRGEAGQFANIKRGRGGEKTFS